MCVCGFVDVLTSYYNDNHLRADEITHLGRLNYYVITAKTVTNTHHSYSLITDSAGQP